MTTINAVGNGLAGATGTGSFVGSASPVLTGTPTTAQIGFTDNTKGIVGTTSADEANSGFAGQVITSHITSGSAISLTNNTPANITSISLTAGDWDVTGNILTFGSGANIDMAAYWTSVTSASLPNGSLSSGFSIPSADAFSFPTPLLRVNVNSTTTVYLSVQAGFSSGTVSACGTIYARRMR